jgi:hypothetical protein
MIKHCLLVLTGLAVATAAVEVRAQSPAANPGVAATTGAPATPAPAVPPPPYSLPWQLRPAAVASVLRSDTTMAFYKVKNAMTMEEESGSTVASTFLGSYKITPSFAPLVRFAIVQNQEPGEALGSGTAFVNPIIGLMYGRKIGSDFRLSAFLGGTVPVGMGGDKPRGKDETAAAAFRGIAARSAMDNAMFAVNFFTGIGGLDFAYVAHKVTVQAEATLLQLLRVRHKAIEPDEKRTNLTAGLHLGYFVLPVISLAGEVRYQRWLSDPAALKTTPTARETLTYAVGPRFHFKVGGTTWIRPGLSYATAIDKPLKDSKYHIVQLDLPVAF